MHWSNDTTNKNQAECVAQNCTPIHSQTLAHEPEESENIAAIYARLYSLDFAKLREQMLHAMFVDWIHFDVNCPWNRALQWQHDICIICLPGTIFDFMHNVWAIGLLLYLTCRIFDSRGNKCAVQHCRGEGLAQCSSASECCSFVMGFACPFVIERNGNKCNSKSKPSGIVKPNHWNETRLPGSHSVVVVAVAAIGLYTK